MTLIDFVFPKLPPPKMWPDKCVKTSVSFNPSASNMVNVLKHCWYLHHCTIMLLIDHWKVNWVSKSLCYCHAILWLLLNTLAADEKYPLLKRDNLTIPIQMQLSQKQKNFAEFFAEFLKSIKIFEYSKKKDDPHRFSISEITRSENVIRSMS